MRNYGKNKKNKSLDCISAIFCVGGEMLFKNGEDSFYYAATNKESIVSVFDGCGGIGSRRYNNYSGKTGAYIASRAVCGGVKQWFESENKSTDTMYEYIKRTLEICDKFADEKGRIKGSLGGKTFPTTAAVIYTQGNTATCFWAGDSRCYMLDSDGLHQLSDDDISGEDALSNISGDGVLTNVICSSNQFTLHSKKVKINRPCALFTATDGCFGYISTPMDFEYLLTDTLISSNSLVAWKRMLDAKISE